MTQPLAIVLYEKLLPGSQLVNRLQDLNYRVRALSEAETLLSVAEQEKPMVVFVDLVSAKNDMTLTIQKLHQNEETSHLPVIAFGPEDAPGLQQSALAAGAVLATQDAAILSHLPEFLEQALRLD
jgi:PleD family two-component response regulator